MPFRRFARAFLPPLVRILARKPDFLAFLTLLLRAFSIVDSVSIKGFAGGSLCIVYFLVPNVGVGMITECAGSCKRKPDLLLTAEHAESAENRGIVRRGRIGYFERTEGDLRESVFNTQTDRFDNDKSHKSLACTVLRCFVILSAAKNPASHPVRFLALWPDASPFGSA